MRSRSDPGRETALGVGDRELQQKRGCLINGSEEARGEIQAKQEQVRVWRGIACSVNGLRVEADGWVT